MQDSVLLKIIKTPYNYIAPCMPKTTAIKATQRFRGFVGGTLAAELRMMLHVLAGSPMLVLLPTKGRFFFFMLQVIKSRAAETLNQRH